MLLMGCEHGTAFKRPDEIRFDATTADLTSALAKRCTQQRVRRIDPPFLSDVHEQLMQIDCEGFQFLGAGRHVEFIIRDGRLVMVWLIVTQADAESMVAAMTAAYNAPSRRNDEYVAFEPYRAAWRYHPAEILFWAPEMDRELDENFR